MADKVPYLDLPAQIRGIRKEIDAAIARTIDHCSFCLGPDVAQFEKDFARFIGAEHCVAFNSGTSALHVALLLLGVGPGDEVVTTPFTFVATSWAISYVGAKPVYVDVDDATMNLDPKLLERAITPRTKAVLPVHLYGHPFDLDPILAICRKHKLPLVEDACQAHGAKYKGKTVGAAGDISCFSFYPGKNLGACGEGGALVTNNASFAARARSLREHGSTVRYYHDEVGFNYRMEGIQGAVLGVKLPHLQKWTDARRRVAHRYNELLRDTPLQLPQRSRLRGKRLPSLRRAPSAPRRTQKTSGRQRRRLRAALSAAAAPAKVLREPRPQAGRFSGRRKGRARMFEPADLSRIDRRANPARGGGHQGLFCRSRLIVLMRREQRRTVRFALNCLFRLKPNCRHLKLAM